MNGERADMVITRTTGSGSRERIMKYLSAAVFCAVLLSIVTCSENAAKKEDITAAVAAVHAWLGVLDSGSFAESHALTGELFRNQLPASKWTEIMNQTRTTLGGAVSRAQPSARYATSLPGVPDGEYVVVTIRTAFEKKKKAVETVTAVAEEGTWKVVGYYIK